MTEIAITGACGRMGRVIAGLVSQRTDCKIIAGVDVAGEQYSDFPVYKKVFDLPQKPDVIIDFSHPSALPDLLSYGKMNNVPLVLATTGYTDEERAQRRKERIEASLEVSIKRKVAEGARLTKVEYARLSNEQRQLLLKNQRERRKERERARNIDPGYEPSSSSGWGGSEPSRSETRSHTR